MMRPMKHDKIRGSCSMSDSSEESSYDSSAVNSYPSSNGEDLTRVLYNLFTDTDGLNIVEAVLALQKSVDAVQEAMDRQANELKNLRKEVAQSKGHRTS